MNFIFLIQKDNHATNKIGNKNKTTLFYFTVQSTIKNE